jgi:hypothetical protein
MTRRLLAKLGLAALMLTATALPARAALITVTGMTGVNLTFTATVSSGTIDFTFDTTSEITKANGTPVLPTVPAIFPDLSLTTGPVTPFPPPPNVSFTPSFNFTQFTIVDGFGDTVILDYLIAVGQTKDNLLNLTGTAFVDPFSPNTSFTNGVNTYDLTAFLNPVMFGFTFTDESGNLVNAISTGNGNFDGGATFALLGTPEPSSVVLLGVGGLLTVVARRRRKA